MHIVTLEDPIEFMHPHIKATFSQRELGRDFFAFPDGLRAARRQAPKVILVGEIRDRETMEIALTAAETGHVVYSTLHTISAAQTINRILGMFTMEEEKQVRDRLAETLRYVISQRSERADKPRHPENGVLCAPTPAHAAAPDAVPGRDGRQRHLRVNVRFRILNADSFLGGFRFPQTRQCGVQAR